MKLFHCAVLAPVCLASSCVEAKQDLSSYESAVAWVQSAYDTEVLRPDSSVILRAEYFPDSPDKWLIVFMKANPKKGYIHRGVPRSLWLEWNSAPSKGKWYSENLRGNLSYRFVPES